ncbi:MAG: hypothetical protein KC464_25300 [Myxococcales bacterium]|nr:hypothetical protein [Myxococcales bacterium]
MSSRRGRGRAGWLRGPVSIRRSLLRNLVLLIVLTAGAILAVTFIGADRAVDGLSRSLIERTGQRTDSELHRFFDPVTRGLDIGAAWGRSGLLDPTATEDVNRLFLPVVASYPQVSSVLLADDAGRETMLLQQPDGWVDRITRADEWAGRSRWRILDRAGATVSEAWRDLGYDPRRRPWYRGAVDDGAPGEVRWTPPYTFFTTGEPGMTAAVRWAHPDRPGLTHVLGFDVTLLDVSRFTTGLQVGAHGLVVVLTDDGLVLGLPRDPRFGNDDGIKAAVLRPAEAIGSAPVEAAVARWRRDAGAAERFRFTAGGDAWWAGFQPFALGNRTLWIAVMVPEADFLGGVKRQRNFIVGIAAGALVLAGLMASLMARAYGKPLEQLAAGSERIRQLDLAGGPPIASRLAEVAELADAQDQMLSALQSFARYVPTGVVRELVRQGQVAEIGGRTAQLTVLFTDIRGFASIAERMTPQALTAHLAEYFEAMLTEMRAEHATVDKLIGDAIMAFWGAPAPDEDHVVHAVGAVLRCTARLAELNAAWRARGLPELPTCFGMDTGPVVVGNVGARERLSYTVLGDTVNLASRLEGINRHYGTDVLAAEAVRDAAGDGFVWRRVDVVAVKGRRQGVPVYELLGRAGEVDAETLAWARDYEAALDAYRSRRFDEALATLRDLAARRDHPSLLRLRERCEQAAAATLPDDWDGVERMTEK